MSDVVKGTPRTDFNVDEIKGLLAEGKSRKEIAEYHNQSVAFMARTVWQDPELKNLKAKSQDVFTLTRSTPVATATEQTTPVATEEVVEEVVATEETAEGIADNSTNTWGQ